MVNLPPYAIELQEAVAKKGLRQYEAAGEAGVPRQTFGDFYNGKIQNIDRVNLETRMKIWKKFPISSLYHPAFDPLSETDSPQLRLQKLIVQKYHGRVELFAKEAGISPSTVYGFLREETDFRPPILAKVYKESNLECFNPSRYFAHEPGPQPSQESLAPPQQLDDSTLKEIREGVARIEERLLSLESRNSGKETTTPKALASANPIASAQRAEHVEDSLFILGYALEEIRNDPGARKLLRDNISPPYVGALTGFLNALFRDETTASSFIDFIPPLTGGKRRK